MEDHRPPPGQVQAGPDETDPAVRLVEADPTWPARFAAEAARIGAALGPLALGVDHVGSTAVPGLAAKPIIDLQLSVAQVQPMDPTDRRWKALATGTPPIPTPTAWSATPSSASRPPGPGLPPPPRPGRLAS